MEYMKLNIQLFADGKVVIETDLDEKGFKDGLNNMQNTAKKGFNTIAKGVGVATTAMAGLIGFGVKYNAEIEQLQTSFEVMTGSAEKARDVISELQKIGAETPFEVKDLAKATNLLMSFGFGAEDAIDSMLMLGDIAQGSSEKLDTISKAYGRMVSSQKVTLEDMNMMIDSGFNPLQIIVENTGESMKSLYDRISKGTMSVEEITEAMKQATSVGGKYFQSMEKQSKTFNGQLSTLQDNWNNLTGKIAEFASEILTDKVLPALNGILSNSDKILGKIQEILPYLEAIGIALLSWKIGALIQSIVVGFQTAQVTIALFTATTNGANIAQAVFNGTLTITEGIVALLTGKITLMQLATAGLTKAQTLLNSVMSANPIGLVIVAIGALIAIIVVLWNKVDWFREFWTSVWEGIKDLTKKAVNYIVDLFGKIITSINDKVDQFKSWGKNVVNKVKEGIASIKDIGKELISGMWDGIKEKWNSLKNKVADLGKGIVNKFKSVFGIHSPSRLFRDEIGKQLSAGIGVGFENELSNVYKDMQRAIDLETSKMSANVQTNSTYQMANKGNQPLNIIDNTSSTHNLVVDGEILATVVNNVNDKKDLQYMF